MNLVWRLRLRTRAVATHAIPLGDVIDAARRRRKFLEPPIEDHGMYPRPHHALHELLDDSVFATLSRPQLLTTALAAIDDRSSYRPA